MSKPEMMLTSTIPTPEYYLHLLWAEESSGRETDTWAVVMPASAGRREAVLKAADFNQNWMMDVMDSEDNQLNWKKVPIRPYLQFQVNSFDFADEEEKDVPTS